MGSTLLGKKPKNDKYLQDATRRGIGYAEDAFNKGYSAYENPRVAQLSGNEAMASGLAAQGQAGMGNRASAESAYGQAQGVFGRSSADGLEKYINPYTKNVLDIGNRELGRSYDVQREKLQGSAASRGAFGGSRQAILESEAQRNFLQAQGDLYGKGMADAYDKALSASASDLARQGQGMLATGSGLASLGAQADAARQDQLRALLATGEGERGIQQAGMDAQYESYLRGQDYQTEALDRYLASLGAGQAIAPERQRSGGLLPGLLQATGSVVGGIYGGPGGAAAGGAAGGALGTAATRS